MNIYRKLKLFSPTPTHLPALYLKPFYLSSPHKIYTIHM